LFGCCLAFFNSNRLYRACRVKLLELVTEFTEATSLWTHLFANKAERQIHHQYIQT